MPSIARRVTAVHPVVLADTPPASELFDEAMEGHGATFSIELSSDLVARGSQPEGLLI